VNFRQIFYLFNPSGQTLKQCRSAKCYHRPIFDLYTCQYGPQEDFLKFCLKKKKFLLKNDKFLLQKTYTFLGVFLNLHRGKTVKYFLISLLHREIKPFIYQTKQTRALYHACSLSYFDRKMLTLKKRSYTYGVVHCIVFIESHRISIILTHVEGQGSSRYL
jgi:hypothetical protein